MNGIDDRGFNLPDTVDGVDSNLDYTIRARAATWPGREFFETPETPYGMGLTAGTDRIDALRARVRASIETIPPELRDKILSVEVNDTSITIRGTG